MFFMWVCNYTSGGSFCYTCWLWVDAGLGLLSRELAAGEAPLTWPSFCFFSFRKS